MHTSKLETITEIARMKNFFCSLTDIGIGGEGENLNQKVRRFMDSADVESKWELANSVIWTQMCDYAR